MSYIVHFRVRIIKLQNLGHFIHSVFLKMRLGQLWGMFERNYEDNSWLGKAPLWTPTQQDEQQGTGKGTQLPC